MNKFVIYGILAMIFGQAIIWFQTNGQFLWEGFKKYPIIVSFLGWPVSFMMIYGTKWFYEGLGEVIWPGRLIGFGCGMLIFGFLTHYLMNEPVTPKTGITIALALCIVCIQIFVK